jgi:hypothetical protein
MTYATALPREKFRSGESGEARPQQFSTAPRAPALIIGQYLDQIKADCRGPRGPTDYG